MTNPIPNINIVRLQKSGGVVGRNATFRKVARMSRIREYFSGAVTKLDYHSNILKFDDVQIYRIGSNIHAPASALPIGEQSAINPTQPKEMVPDEKLNAKILAVSNANQESEIVYKNVAGFVHVTRVDLEKREITVSAPAPGKLPKRFLIVGTLEWLEE
jgi:polyribonucleotide 5'-hydroxyl-kinase